MTKYHKRKYTPIHPEKYEGDPTAIIARSSWETKFFIWCDHNSAVVSWSSEELIVPYKCRTDNKWHRYFPDAKVKIRDANGNLRVYVVEIKPAKQTRPPDTPKRKTKQYINEVLTWGKNESKWEAAIEYCKDRGWEFKIITEKELNV